MVCCICWSSLAGQLRTSAYGLHVDNKGDAEKLAKWLAHPQRQLKSLQLVVAASSHETFHSICRSLAQHAKALQHLHVQIDRLKPMDVAALMEGAGNPHQELQHLVLCAAHSLTPPRFPADTLPQLTSAFKQLQSLTLHNLGLSEGMSALEGLTCLTTLTLINSVQVGHPIPALPPSLQQLSIQQWHPVQDTAPPALFTLTTLTSLQLSGKLHRTGALAAFDRAPLVLPHLSRLQQLQHLEVSHQDISPAAVPADISILTGLTYLNLSCSIYNRTSDPYIPELGPLAALSTLTQLQVLELQFCCVRKLSISVLARLTSLTYLDLSYTHPHSDSRLEPSLAPLGALQNLKHLDIRRAGLKQWDFSPLSALTALTYLCVSKNVAFTGESADVMFGMKQLRYLAAAYQCCLSVDSSEMTRLTQLSGLTCLDLSGWQKDAFRSIHPMAPRGDGACDGGDCWVGEVGLVNRSTTAAAAAAARTAALATSTTAAAAAARTAALATSTTVVAAAPIGNAALATSTTAAEATRNAALATSTTVVAAAPGFG